LVFGGCGSDATQETSRGTVSENTQSTRPSLSVEWTYDEVEGEISDVELVGQSLYLRDSGANLHRLDTASGERFWYLSNVPETNRLISASRTPVLASSSPLSLHGYSPDGDKVFEIGPSDILNFQGWDDRPITYQLVIEGNTEIFIVGKVQDAPAPSCYAVSVDVDTGTFSKANAWHTAGLTDSFPQDDGFVIGGWTNFPAYVEKIGPYNNSEWATPLDIRKYTRVDSIQTDPSGNVYANFTTEESEGVVAFDADGTIKWKHQRRGAPDENYNILVRSIVTSNRLIIPYVPDGGRPKEVQLIALNKESGEKETQTVVTISDNPSPAHIFTRININNSLFLGIRTSDSIDSTLWKEIALPELTPRGDVTLPVGVNQFIGSLSTSQFLHVGRDAVSLISTT
jgi:hypothetical protein